jgi:hypothetical protein
LSTWKSCTLDTQFIRHFRIWIATYSLVWQNFIEHLLFVKQCCRFLKPKEITVPGLKLWLVERKYM